MNTNNDSGRTDSEEAKGKRRDRLRHATCEGEPTPYRAYQRMLSRAFTLNRQSNRGKRVNKRKRIEMYRILTRNADLPKTRYQLIRTRFLLGECYAVFTREDILDVDPDFHDEQSPLAMAAEQYRQAAEVAYQAHDLALYAQLKKMESDACLQATPKQFQRAFHAASDALKAWRDAEYRDLADDDHFEFKLADTVGVRGHYVAEYTTAADALDRAGVLLHRLMERPDADKNQLANDSVYLDWDWASLSLTRGEPRFAFHRIMRVRKQGLDLFQDQDRARLSYIIAVIAMDCIEHGGVEGFNGARLAAVADTEIEKAKVFAARCHDESLDVLILLADARSLGLLKIEEGRSEAIEKAARIAEKSDDPLLPGHVALARGDDWRLRRQKRRARKCYREVIADMTAVGFLELVSVAERRLALMSSKSAGKSTSPPPRRRIAPPQGDKILRN